MHSLRRKIMTERAPTLRVRGDEHLTEPLGDESPDDQTPSEGRDPVEAYRHDPAVSVMAARLADSAFEAAARSWDVNEHMRALAAQEGLEPDGPLGRELFQAVSYRLRLDPGGKVGCALRSSPDTEHYAWPPRIGEVEPDVVALWRDVAGLVEHPAAIAPARRPPTGECRSLCPLRPALLLWPLLPVAGDMREPYGGRAGRGSQGRGHGDAPVNLRNPARHRPRHAQGN
jgi:hypothetical protein